MADLKVVAWVEFDNEYPTKRINQGNIHEVLDAIKQNIIENNYMFSGEEHQNALTGAPLFNDGTCFRASMRCFGSIMSSIYCKENENEMSYMEFYMTRNDSRLPEVIEHNVKPSDEESAAIGLSLRQDQQLVIESLSMGMPLMSTDKVVMQLYSFFKMQLEDRLDNDLDEEE